MNPGDIVKKVFGEYDKNKVAVVISVETNSCGNTTVEVLSEGKIRNWYGKYLEVVNEDKKDI